MIFIKEAEASSTTTDSMSYESFNDIMKYKDLKDLMVPDETTTGNFFNLFFIITYEIHFINFIIIFLKYFLKIKKNKNLSKYRLKITNKL